MKRVVLIALVVALLPACASLGSGPERVVLVDYRNDEFGSHYWRFFPGSIEAHAGDTIVFRRQWTGEPHTVTFGRLADRSLDAVTAVEQRYADLDEDSPDELLDRAEAEYNAALGGLPVFDPYRDASAQNAEQPCYLERGPPPSDPDTPCSKREQQQPRFDGRQSYYSSGFIPPSGPSDNEYRVRLSDDIQPGTYRYYCVIHFPDMQGRVVVKPEGTGVASQSELNRRALAEIRELSRPLEHAYREAGKGQVRTAGAIARQPIAGFHYGEEFTTAVDAFVPRSINTRVGRPVTWTIVGAHTVSFGVPRYLPIYFVDDDGTVRRNPVVDRAAGGSPKAPPVDFAQHIVEIDGGTYDGSGFLSSGLLGSEPYSLYTLRFSKPGRYKYACLVHPPMVGTVVVSN